VEAVTSDSAAMKTLIEERVRRVPGVVSVETFPYLSLYYQEAQYSIARSKEAGSPPGVRPVRLTDFDCDLARLLSTDGRMPYNSIATALGVSETMVRQHIQRLTEAGALRVMCIVNPLRLGFRAVAWLAIRVTPGARLADVAEALAATRQVTYVAILAGRFDIIAEVVCVDQAELLELVDSHVRVLPSISSTEIAMYMDLRYKALVPQPSG
jgi:DNA-binding Lrp family transcriptional regulator